MKIQKKNWGEGWVGGLGVKIDVTERGSVREGGGVGGVRWM